MTADATILHPLDPVLLDRYLRDHLPGYTGGLVIEQFTGG
jgi:aminoglycoside phosphotransferase (APT) family kinase protein